MSWEDEISRNVILFLVERVRIFFSSKKGHRSILYSFMENISISKISYIKDGKSLKTSSIGENQAFNLLNTTEAH